MIGVVWSASRKRRAISSVPFRVMPASSARWLERWIGGPLGHGVGERKASSMMSAPAGQARMISNAVSASGSPATI